MITTATTSDSFAYLDRDVPGDAVAKYVPESRMIDGKEAPATTAFGEDGFGFDDFLDIVNPLQHIPFISSIYREITGDDINPGSRMIGGALFSGGVGLAVSFINSAIEDSTGRDIGEHVIALFSSSDTDVPEESIAEATPVEIPPDVMSPKPALQLNDSAPASAPDTGSRTAIGLEWKGDKPDLLLNLERAKAAHAEELTPAQLDAVFKSFRAKPSESNVPASQAHAVYQKSVQASAFVEIVEPPAQAAADITAYPDGEDR